MGPVWLFARNLMGESAVYGLPERTRCIIPQSGEQERNRWLISSFCPSHNKIYLADYDEDTGEISTFVLDHPKGRPYSLASNPNAANQFVTSFDDTAALWKIGADVPSESFRSEAIHSLEQLASFPRDYNIKSVIWEASSRAERLLTHSGKSAEIFQIMSGSSTISHSVSLSTPADGSIYCSAWNPFNDQNVAIGKGTTIFEIDIRSNQYAYTYIQYVLITYHLRKQSEIPNSHDINVRSIDYNHNKPNMLVSGGDDGMVRVWDTRNVNAPLKEFSDHSHWIWCVQINKFHDQLLLTCSSDAQVNLQSIVSVSSTPVRAPSPSGPNAEEDSGGEPPVDGLIKAYEQHEESVYSVAWSPADPWIFASVSYEGRLVVNTVPQDHKYKIIM